MVFYFHGFWGRNEHICLSINSEWQPGHRLTPEITAHGNGLEVAPTVATQWIVGQLEGSMNDKNRAGRTKQWDRIGFKLVFFPSSWPGEQLVPTGARITKSKKVTPSALCWTLSRHGTHLLVVIDGGRGEGGDVRRGPAVRLRVHQLRTGYSRCDDGAGKAMCIQYVYNTDNKTQLECEVRER